MKKILFYSLNIFLLFILISCENNDQSDGIYSSIEDNKILTKSDVFISADSVECGSSSSEVEEMRFFTSLDELKQFITENNIKSLVENPVLESPNNQYNLSNTIVTQPVFSDGGNVLMNMPDPDPFVYYFWDWVFQKVKTTGYTTATKISTEAVSYVDPRYGFPSGRYVADVYRVELKVSCHKIDEFFTDESFGCGYISNPVYGGGFFWQPTRGYWSQILDNSTVKLVTYVIYFINSTNFTRWMPVDKSYVTWEYWNYVYEKFPLVVVIDKDFPPYNP